jgi:ribosomal protein S18 acetylase RimI-like enzyme
MSQSRETLQFLLRPAQRDDVPAIVRLLADDPLGALREDGDATVAPSYWQAFDDMARQPGNFVLVAELAGDVVACLQLTLIAGLSRRGAKRALIEGVRVARRCRGRGLGEIMLRWAIGHARAEGCALVQLTTDNSRTEARRFYERLGFVASHVGMKLSLDRD